MDRRVTPLSGGTRIFVLTSIFVQIPVCLLRVQGNCHIQIHVEHEFENAESARGRFCQCSDNDGQMFFLFIEVAANTNCVCGTERVN